MEKEIKDAFEMYDTEHKGNIYFKNRSNYKSRDQKYYGKFWI